MYRVIFVQGFKASLSLIPVATVHHKHLPLLTVLLLKIESQIDHIIAVVQKKC